MTCLDWLQRLRPDSQVLKHAHGNVGVGPDVAVLSRSMCKLALEWRHDEKEEKNKCYRLSQGLLMLDMEDDAKVAYQADFLVEESSNKPNKSWIYCSACDNPQTKDEPFYTCRTCLDTDFCHECMSKHEKQPILDICRGHKFLRIVVADAKIRPDQTEAFDEWLLSICERLQPLSGDREIEEMIKLTIDEREK